MAKKKGFDLIGWLRLAVIAQIPAFIVLLGVAAIFVAILSIASAPVMKYLPVIAMGLGDDLVLGLALNIGLIIGSAYLSHKYIKKYLPIYKNGFLRVLSVLVLAGVFNLLFAWNFPMLAISLMVVAVFSTIVSVFVWMVYHFTKWKLPEV